MKNHEDINVCKAFQTLSSDIAVAFLPSSTKEVDILLACLLPS